PSRRPAQEPELVLAHEGVVADIEVHIPAPFEAAQEVGLLLEDMERDLRVYADQELPIGALGAGASDGAFDAAYDCLRGEDAPRAAAVDAGFGEGVVEGGSYPLASHLDEPELGDLEG